MSKSHLKDKQGTMQVARDKRKKFFWIILFFSIYICFEAFSYFTLFVIGKFRDIDYDPLITDTIPKEQKQALDNLLKDETKYLTYSSVLGWTIKKNGVAPLYRANSQGIRANSEYQQEPSPDVIRISTFGDSYTHCDDVSNEETWQEKIMDGCSYLEVLNFGVEGYGLDQSFLYYQQNGIQYNSHIVIIGFMSENIARSVNVYRPFYYSTTGIPLTKPFYSIQNDDLLLHENQIHEISQIKDLLEHPEILLPRFGLNDHHFQRRYKRSHLDFLPSVRLFKVLRFKFVKGGEPAWNWCYNVNSEAFKITSLIFKKFYDSVIQSHSVPIIAVFPNKFDIMRFRMDGTKIYEPLLAYFKEQEYSFIDLMAAFEKDVTLEIEEIEKSHYTPLANESVANYIFGYLKEEGLTNKENIEEKIQLLKKQNR